jgi:hypothetical protein
MRETYSEADKVLVLDSFMLTARSQGASDLEIALRIICSGWSRRLWTLQEGVLARRLCVQFGDGSVNLDAIRSSLASDEKWREYTTVCYNLDEIRGAWQRKADLVKSGQFLDYASAALRFRATSVATDEALCLATLAGLDMEKILAEKPKERMKKVWSLLPIPAKIVFRTGDTLDEAGFCWAPSSLLSFQKMRTIEESQASVSDVLSTGIDLPIETFLEDFEPTSFDYHETGTPLGTTTPAGLEIQWHGIRVGPWTGSLATPSFVLDEKGRFFLLSPHMGQTPDSLPLPRSGATELALLLEKPVDELLSDAGESVNSTTALILSVSRESDGAIFAHVESVGWIYPQVPYSEDGVDLAPVLGMVEACRAALKLDSRKRSAASPGPSSAGEEPHVQCASVQLIDMGDEEEPLEVRRSGGGMTVLRNGEHIFFDCRNTSAMQTWCID